MDLTTGCRRSFSEPVGGAGGGADRISALPDDLLLLVLARLGCAATAARAGVLARRWRDLWTRLPVLAFRGVPFDSLEPALDRVSSVVSLLEIRVPDDQRGLDSEEEPRLYSPGVDRLLLAPENFVFALPLGSVFSLILADMPGLHRATSIVLESQQFLHLFIPTGVEYPALRTLSLSGCVVDVNALLSRCPRIRVLNFKDVSDLLFSNWDGSHLKVHSASLQDLVAGAQNEWTRHVDIVAPSLKQLTISFRSLKELNISIFAPMVEKVSWHCYYSTGVIGFGLWCLEGLWLHTAEKQGKIPSLHIHARNNWANFSGDDPNFRQEIEKHMVVEFSVLELHITAMGHVFGAFVLYLLEMDRISSATRRLKVVLPRSKEKDRCPKHCPCEPTNWRTQIVSLSALEEVEIIGLLGEDHEFDFLKLIL